MAIFSKIDKKLFIILIITLVCILLVGLAVYKYIRAGLQDAQNSAGGAQTENDLRGNSGLGDSIPNVQIEGEGAMFSVCIDRCGDETCQPSDPDCKDNLNCICPETHQDCPEDCN